MNITKRSSKLSKYYYKEYASYVCIYVCMYILTHLMDQTLCFGTQNYAGNPSGRAKSNRRNTANQRRTGRRSCGIPTVDLDCS